MSLIVQAGPEAVQELAKQADNITEFMGMLDNVEGGNGQNVSSKARSQAAPQPGPTG